MITLIKIKKALSRDEMRKISGGCGIGGGCNKGCETCNGNSDCCSGICASGVPNCPTGKKCFC